jgi:hypothetical protein
VRIDGAGLGNRTPDNPAAADQVAALPDDAWLALGFGDLGGSLNKALAQLSQLSQLGTAAAGAEPGTVMPPDLNGMLNGATKKAGIDIQRDLLSWMGAGAVYVRGHSLLDIGAVLTVKTKDAAKSTRAVKLLGDLLRQTGREVEPAQVPGYDTAIKSKLSEGAPISIYIAANGERFSAGVNPEALTAVNAPAKTFGDSEAYANATKSLGGELRPVFVLDFPSVVSLLEGFGLSNNPGFAKVKPYLDAYGSIAVGTVHDGDVSRFALAVGLR